MTKKTYAKRISPAKWEERKAKIVELLPGNTYADIVAYLVNECGFKKSLTKAQLGTQLQKRWKIAKYTKSHRKVKANAKLKAREGRPTEILIDDRRYTKRQVKKAAAAEARQKRKADQDAPGQSTQKHSGGKRPKRTATDADGIAEDQQLCPSSPDNIIVRTPPALKASVASPSNLTGLVRMLYSQTPIDAFDPWFEHKFLHLAEMMVIPLLDTAALYKQQPNTSQPCDWAVLDSNSSRNSESALSKEFTSNLLNIANPTLSQLQSLMTKLAQEGYIEHPNKFPSIFKLTEQFQVLRSLVYLGSNNLLPHAAVDMLLEWISTHKLLWIVQSLIGSQLPSATIFCSKIFNRAVEVGDTNTVKSMLENGVDPNLKGNFTCCQRTQYSEEQTSPLQAAIVNQDAAMVRVLLNFGAKINNYTVVNQGGGRRRVRTDLDFASDGPRLCFTMIDLLLQHGAKPDVPIPQRNGFTTILNRALELNEIEVVKRLLLAGALVNDHQCGQSLTALQTASRYCDEEIVQLIIKAGADVNIPIGSEYNVAKEIAMATSNYEFLVTPLQYAVKRDDIAVVKLLLTEEAFVDGFEFNTFLPRGHKMVDLDDSGDGDFEAIEDIDAQAGRDTFKSYIEDRLDKDEEDIFPFLQDLSLYSPLQAAASNKNLAMVQLLLEHDCTINMVGGLGTALQVACMQQGNMEIVKLLVEKGADVNSPAHPRYGLSALQAAILLGDIEVAEYLLEKNADVKAPATSVLGRTALQTAAKKGYTQLAIKLIARGANVNEATSMHGETCLHFAARSGNMELVCLLLKHGAHVNKPVEARAWNTSILFQAISSGKHEIVEKIIGSGADMRRKPQKKARYGLISAAVQHCSRETVELLLRKGASPNKKDDKGSRPLEHAVYHASLDTVQLLLDFKANPNAKNTFQPSMLTSAILRNNEDLVRMLIANGADVNSPDDYLQQGPLAAAIRVGNLSIFQILVANKSKVHGARGIEGLVEAVDANRMDMVQCLLSLGLNAKHIDDDDYFFPRLPLATAITEGNQEMIDVLLDHDTGFYSKDSKALPRAVKRGDWQLIQRLLSLKLDGNAQRAYNEALVNAVYTVNLGLVEALITAGADVNAFASGVDSWTILDASIYTGSLALVRLLLQKGAHVNPLRTDGNFKHTPLQRAVHRGNSATVKLLLSHGADANAPGATFNGGTALELAAKMGRLELVHMILEHDEDPATLKQRIKSAAGLARWKGHPLVAKYMEDWQKNGSGANAS